MSQVLQFGLFDILEHLGDDWKDLNVDSVELVQADPLAALCNTWKESAHDRVCDLVSAVVHNTEHS